VHRNSKQFGETMGESKGVLVYVKRGRFGCSLIFKYNIARLRSATDHVLGTP